uniref:Uncharacterized protein n=1 Tax=Coptotermes formosanus TaxID=36987 RepID=R4UKG7_COPFO|nr:hypothetical protein [Coptotermes formosanus]
MGTSMVVEGTDSQESSSDLQDRQDKNPEILCDVANEQKNVNNITPKTEQSKKKRKRGKKPVGCSIPGSKHVMEVPKIHSNYMKCESDSIQSVQNVLLTQKLEPLMENHHDITDAMNLVEVESTGMEQQVSECCQGESIIVEEKGRTPELECVDIPNQESCIPPPDHLADIQHETEFLRTSELVPVLDYAIPVNEYGNQKEADISVMKKDSKLREMSSLPVSRGKRGHRKRKKCYRSGPRKRK